MAEQEATLMPQQWPIIIVWWLQSQTINTLDEPFNWTPPKDLSLHPRGPRKVNGIKQTLKSMDIRRREKREESIWGRLQVGTRGLFACCLGSSGDISRVRVCSSRGPLHQWPFTWQIFSIGVHANKIQWQIKQVPLNQAWPEQSKSILIQETIHLKTWFVNEATREKN